MKRTLRGKALLQLLDRYLREGASIEMEGIGCLTLRSTKQVALASHRIRVFLAYADEDRVAAKRLSLALHKAEFEPWMDQEKLLPGQNWPYTIERAIELSDFVIACFSRRSVCKRGHFQCELTYALQVASRVPAGEIFLLPVRLDDCSLPPVISRAVQHADLFPDWERGVGELLKAMWHQTLARGSQLQVRS